MAGSLNKVTLIGNLGKDPEVKTLNNGRVANFSIATSESWKDKQTGEKQEKTEWHNVVCYQEGLIGVISQYLSKGSKVYIEGQLKTRKWTSKAGENHYATEVVLGFGSQLIMLGGRENGEARTSRREERPQVQGRFEEDDDD